MTVDLSFTDTGTGPGAPLVILHGLFGSKRNWSSIAGRLAEHHRVLSVDLRNHGESPWDARHDYPAMAGDVARLIERAVGGPATLIGHSMGGKAAMVVALTRPELVDRLVVVDIAPAPSTATSVDYLRAMKAVPLTTLARRAEVATALADAIPDLAIRAFLAHNVRSGPEGLAWGINLDALERHFDAILGFPDMPSGQAFTKPTVFIVGGRSKYVGSHHQPEIARLFPAATIDVIEGAGHWVHAEAPELFLEALNRFLKASPETHRPPSG